MTSVSSLRRSVTDGVADWLARLIEEGSLFVPPRESPAYEPHTAEWLHRFVREIVTVDPTSGHPLTNIQVFLLESALECVEWDDLVRDTRLRGRDWMQARRSYP